MNKCVLLVDDSASMRSITRLMLEQAGYGVVEAVDGLDALAKLDRNHFDLLITDLSMPQMDGLTLLRRVKAQQRHQALPVLLLTTESAVARKEEARRAGARAWMTKPIAPAELLDVVNRYCPRTVTP